MAKATKEAAPKAADPDAHEEPADEENESEGAREDDQEAREDRDADAESDIEADPDPDEPLMVGLRRWFAGGRIPQVLSLFFGLVLPGIVLGWHMWRVHTFTIDDAYISFRYSRNFAKGLGLVYNEGERIEGYTNFLWTVILGIGIKVGLDPDKLSKILGAAASFGTLALVYRLSGKLSPYKTLPCVATWLLATTVVFSGYAVFGLETAFFVFLLVAGTSLLFAEEKVMGGGERADKLPISGLVFALAGLTRPEAPAFIGILMIFLGPTRWFAKRNLTRGAMFAVPVVIHLLWRHSYYGAWVPNTLGAKTGNLNGQLHAGWGYVQSYAAQASALLWVGLLGFSIGLVKQRRDLLAISAITVFVCAYVVLVGGDWMPFFRFMAPFEPFCFLLVCVGARRTVDGRSNAPALALAIFSIAMFFVRLDGLHLAQKQFLEKEKRFWDIAAGGTAEFFKKSNLPRGELALGDIGEIGYKTDFPILDLLGLVDPVIAKLPGGYTQKLGPGFNDHLFERMPEYVLIISSSMDCQHPSVSGSIAIYRDRRFLPAYDVAGKVPLEGGFAWCIYRKKH
jgi:hypothetical protein